LEKGFGQLFFRGMPGIKTLPFGHIPGHAPKHLRRRLDDMTLVILD
jgi:hypothetical protein